MEQLGSILASLLIGMQAAQAGTEPRLEKISANPNERVCEDIKAIGSRLAVKRVCATRAEWNEKRQQDRDVIDEAQRQRGMQHGQ